MWGDNPDRLTHAIWACYIGCERHGDIDTIPSLAKLQNEFGCSRTALLYAISQLEQKGMISRVAKNKAWQVRRGIPMFNGGRLLGVVLPLFTNDVIKHMCDGLQSTVDQLGAHLILMQYGSTIAREQQCVETLIHVGCSSLVIYPCVRLPKQQADDYLNTNQYAANLVLADSGYTEHNYPMVGIDNYKLGYDVTQTLIQMGHQHIAFMGLPSESGTAPSGAVTDRYRAFLNAMHAASLTVTPDDIMVVNPKTEQDFYSPILDYLTKWDLSDHTQTAMICWDDECAQIVLQLAEEHGIELRGRLALAGFDNLEGLREIPLVLSTNNDFFTLGRMAARLALYGIRHGHFYIPANVIIRQEPV